MGLLDSLIDPRIAAEFSPTEQEKQQAKNQALMMTGLGMIGSRGGFGQAMANGGMAGLQSYQQSLDNSRRSKMQQFEAGMTLQGIMEKQKKQKALEEEIARMSPDEQQALRLGVSPTDIWKRKNPEDQYKVVGNSMVRVGGGNVSPVFTAQKEQALPWYVRKGEDGSLGIDPAYSELERAKASLGRPASPYFTPVPTVNGLGRFDNRTGRFELVDGGGIVKPSDDPSLQGKIAEAKEGGSTKGGAEAKRAVNMSGISDVLARAEQLLSDPNNKPTQSGIGTAIDKAGALVGKTPAGAAQADELRVLGGALVSKMPRMEGPQSDRDVQLYRESAGNIGDSTLPIERRIAALGTVRGLLSKYDKQGQQQPQQSGQVRRYNPATGRIE